MKQTNFFQKFVIMKCLLVMLFVIPGCVSTPKRSSQLESQVPLTGGTRLAPLKTETIVKSRRKHWATMKLPYEHKVRAQVINPETGELKWVTKTRKGHRTVVYSYITED